MHKSIIYSQITLRIIELICIELVLINKFLYLWDSMKLLNTKNQIFITIIQIKIDSCTINIKKMVLKQCECDRK